MKPKPLTQAERNWLELLEHLLLNPPSKRISFYTIGDPCITAYDNRFDAEIDNEGTDVCVAVEKLGARLYDVETAMHVHSTAG